MCCLGGSGRGRLFLPLHQGSVIHRASCGCVCAQPQSGGCSPGMPWEGGLPDGGVGLQSEWDLQGMVQVAVSVSVHTQNVWVSRAGEAVEDSSIALAAGESVWAAAGNTAMSLPWHWALSLSPASWVWAFASPHLLLSRQKANTCALSLAHPCCAQVAVSPRGCCRAWCRFLFIFIPVFFGKKIFSFVSCIQVPKPPVTSRNAQVMLE